MWITAIYFFSKILYLQYFYTLREYLSKLSFTLYYFLQQTYSQAYSTSSYKTCKITHHPLSSHAMLSASSLSQCVCEYIRRHTIKHNGDDKCLTSCKTTIIPFHSALTRSASYLRISICTFECSFNSFLHKLCCYYIYQKSRATPKTATFKAYTITKHRSIHIYKPYILWYILHLFRISLMVLDGVIYIFQTASKSTTKSSSSSSSSPHFPLLFITSRRTQPK